MSNAVFRPEDHLLCNGTGTWIVTTVLLTSWLGSLSPGNISKHTKMCFCKSHMSKTVLSLVIDHLFMFWDSAHICSCCYKHFSKCFKDFAFIPALTDQWHCSFLLNTFPIMDYAATWFVGLLGRFATTKPNCFQLGWDHFVLVISDGLFWVQLPRSYIPKPTELNEKTLHSKTNTSNEPDMIIYLVKSPLNLVILDWFLFLWAYCNAMLKLEMYLLSIYHNNCRTHSFLEFVCL